MLGENLEGLLRATSAAEVTELFLWVLVCLFTISILLSVINKGNRFVAYAPNLLTSVGILGTFVGIVIGLMGFDTTDIDGSIGLLLIGLKTAFVTSLAGMGGSILFKILSATPLLMHKSKVVAGKDIGPALVKAAHAQGEQLEQLRIAIAGDEESSLAGQIKLFRGDVRDSHDEMKRSLKESQGLQERLTTTAEQQRTAFDTFTESLRKQLEDVSQALAKGATEQVIEALKQVIVDFNRNLTEQFGENFKALDASVKKLVEWQENYRQQLAQMSEQYQQGVTAITQTEASVANISEKSRAIPKTMENLQTVMQVNQRQIDELGLHLQAFRDIRDKAIEAVPEIRQQVEATVKDVTDAAKAAGEHYKALLDGADAYIKQHDTVAQDILKRFTDASHQSVGELKTAITTGAEEFEANVHRLSGNLTSTSDMVATQTDKIREQLGDTVKDLNENSRAMVDTLVNGAKSLSEESLAMNDSLKQAGQQIMHDIKANQDQVTDSVNQMQQRLEGVMEEVFQAQTREMNKAFEGVASAVADAVTRTGEGVNQQLEYIDESMQKEVERVMTEMGGALAQITGQFTNDYRQLVQAMQLVVQQRGEH